MSRTRPKIHKESSMLKVPRTFDFPFPTRPQFLQIFWLVSDNKAKYEPFPADESVQILAKLVRMN